MQLLTRVGDLIIVNALYLVCCVPIVTIGAATAALHKVAQAIVYDTDNGIFKTFFRAFRENFKKGTLLWLLLLGCAAVLAVLFYLMVLVENTILRMVALIMFCVLFFLVYIAAIYAFPLTAYFENTISATIRNAIGMGLGNLRQTIMSIAVTLVPLALMFLSMKLFVTLLFMLIILGPGAICYGVMCLLLPVFRRYVPGYEEENKEDL
jgi:uncharacterized membrane protein YesL